MIAQSTTPSAAAQKEERDSLIMEHLPQVRLIARRIHDRLPGTMSLDDLISSGTVGLIAAIDRYDAAQGVKLRTYAEYKIKGAILDSLRDMDWAPRRQRQRARSLQAAMAAVEQRNQGQSTVDEVAKELGISLEECQSWMSESRRTSFTSLESTTTDEDGNEIGRQVADKDDSLPSRVFEESELKALLAQSIQHMPRQERTVLSLFYHEELSLREIAKVMNLHESRISQIKMQALSRLRVLFEKNWPKKGTAATTEQLRKLGGAVKQA